MVKICPLASGSKGNSLLLQTNKANILIDVGLSCKEIEIRLSKLAIEPVQIDAILITHEHMDHIKGLKRLSEVYQIPVFCNAETAKGIFDQTGQCEGFKIFTTEELFEYKDMQIYPFSIQHDTLDPVAFRIHVNNLKLGFCTDLGIVTPIVKEQLKNLDFLLLESNHEPSMVMACSRPPIYKERVLSRQGHLSNDQCIKALDECKNSSLKQVFLAHLSEECNNPELALKKAKEIFDSSTLVDIAFQDIVSKIVDM